ncbi:MAG: peptidylprolyl isomerase [Nitrososphaerota archaeon]|jgi:cyclophilin family peptidyl-prolyl cis-trans isomerase|nr:peptidylprolyl isomerase [Nitrososphaerota archaeon]
MAPKKNKKRLTPEQRKRKSNRTTWIAIAAIATVVVVFGILAASGLLGNRSDTPMEPIAPTQVLLETTEGNITIDLRTDKPITSGNFINLVNEGVYDGTTFYRTMAEFMIQGGKGASGGNIPSIKDEIGTNNRNTNYTIAMANTGAPNSASSEFFINVADNGQRISGFNSNYSVFGTVIDGTDVVDAIANAPVTENPSRPGEQSVPVNPVKILRATVLP